MKFTQKVQKDFDVKTLKVSAGARYWEDSTVDGVEDEEGTLIPCRVDDYWCPVIELETGKIINWIEGVTADIHYKVCDDGIYTLQDAEGNTVKELDGYVPSIMCPVDNGYGDYIIMQVNSEGYIQNWRADLSDFMDDED